MTMKAVLPVLAIFLLLLTGAKPEDKPASINWMTWEEAIAANKKTPKKLFVDVYTDWCGWCKRMDATTFKNEVIVEMMDKDFYAIKFDAEQKDSIVWNGKTFRFLNQGRRGAHELAAALLDGQMSYPSFVLLNEKTERMQIVKGYKQPADLERLLAYYGENYYLEGNEKFEANFKSRITE